MRWSRSSQILFAPTIHPPSSPCFVCLAFCFLRLFPRSPFPSCVFAANGLLYMCSALGFAFQGGVVILLMNLAGLIQKVSRGELRRSLALEGGLFLAVVTRAIRFRSVSQLSRTAVRPCCHQRRELLLFLVRILIMPSAQ